MDGNEMRYGMGFGWIVGVLILVVIVLAVFVLIKRRQK